MEYIKVGRLKYKVRVIDGLMSDDGQRLWGEIKYTPQVINIDREVLTNPLYPYVLMHEALHGVMDHLGLPNDEKSITALANVLTDTLMESPALKKALLNG